MQAADNLPKVNTTGRLAELRAKMKAESVAAYLIPAADAHGVGLLFLPGWNFQQLLGCVKSAFISSTVAGLQHNSVSNENNNSKAHSRHVHDMLTTVSNRHVLTF